MNKTCLLIELKKAGLHAQAQRSITVYYDDGVVEEFVVDVIPEDVIILELWRKPPTLVATNVALSGQATERTYVAGH